VADEVRLRAAVRGALSADSGARGAADDRPAVQVLTGGQTGVDTWTAQAALRAGLPVHLIFPRGLRQEDGPLTRSRRARLRGAQIHELSSASFRYRTWTCVYLSDAVVLLDPAGGDGCRETRRAARQLGRPLLEPAPGQADATAVAAWLAGVRAQVIMVAGCRASVLARAHAGRGVRAQIQAVVTAAAELG
jgi:putative molybdenum carrier protein